MTFRWDVFFNYLLPWTAFQNPLIRDGLITTIYIAVLAQLFGTAIGVVCAIGLQSRFTAIRVLIRIYMGYFRGTPLLVQLVLLYFGLSALGLYGFPDLVLGSIVISGVIQAGILGLALNEGAFMTEIVRAGILGVDRGQSEAAAALGMSRLQIMRLVVLPQAVRVILPPFGNNFVNQIKSTPLIVIIGGTELFNAYQQLNGQLFRPFELFLAVSFYYLALIGIWNLIQRRLERRFALPTGTTVRRRWLAFDVRALRRGAQPIAQERV